MPEIATVRRLTAAISGIAKQAKRNSSEWIGSSLVGAFEERHHMKQYIKSIVFVALVAAGVTKTFAGSLGVGFNLEPGIGGERYKAPPVYVVPANAVVVGNQQVAAPAQWQPQTAPQAQAAPQGQPGQQVVNPAGNLIAGATVPPPAQPQAAQPQPQYTGPVLVQPERSGWKFGPFVKFRIGFNWGKQDGQYGY
jgi:hypothetical protein